MPRIDHQVFGHISDAHTLLETILRVDIAGTDPEPREVIVKLTEAQRSIGLALDRLKAGERRD